MAYTTAQVNAWYQSVQFRAGPTATVASYVTLLNSGSMTPTAVQTAIINDTYTAANVNTVIRLYQGAYNRVPDQGGQSYWANIMGATPDAQKTAQLQSIATQFANSTEFFNTYGVNASSPINAAVLTAFYANILNRAPDTGGFTYWLNSGLNTGQVLSQFSQSPEFVNNSNNSVVLYQQAEISGTYASAGSLFQYGGYPPSETLNLTTNVDTLSSLSGNTLFQGISGTGATWTTGDSLTGRDGNNDTFKLIDNTGVAFVLSTSKPVGASFNSVEIFTIVSPNAVTADISGSTYNSFNTLNVTGTTKAALTGGSNDAITLTQTAQGVAAAGAGTTTVDGGTNIVVNSTGAVLAANNAQTGSITVGGTTAPTGTVTVVSNSSSSNVTNADVSTGSAVTVTGGTVVSITATNAATSAAATTIKTGNVTVSNDIGAIGVTGRSATTTVNVTQSAGVTAVASTTAGLAGTTNGAVTIADANAGSATKAATISTVSLNNYGATSSISSNALNSLTLAGTGGTLGITTGLTTPTNTTLNLFTNGLSTTDVNGNAVNGGDTTITDNSAAGGQGFTTINLTTGGSTGSTITGIAAVDVTALNVAGSQVATVTSAAGMTTLATVVVSGAAGLAGGFTNASITSISATGTTGNNTLSIDGTKSTYAGGSGVDTITITASPTKTVSGGSGTADVIVNNAATDIVANNSNISGFEILRAGALVNSTSLAATGFTGLQVGATAGGVTFTNVAANTSLQIDAGPTGGVIYTLANATGASDVLPLILTSKTDLTAGSVTGAGIETVNITNTDTDTAATNINTITLVTNAAKALTVTGNAGLTITNDAGNTSIATFDASGVTAGGVTFLSNTTVANSATVSIKGSAANDTLYGGATVDTILGNAGNDLIAGQTGADSIDGGLGTNTFYALGMTGANIEGAGTGTSTGAVVNLGSTALTNAAVLGATGSNLSGALSSVASNTTAYLYSSASNSNSAVQDTLANIQNVIGSTGGDYIVGSSVANNISNQLAGSQRSSAADVLTGGSGADTFNLFGSTASGTVGTIAAQTAKVTDFAIAADVFAVSDTVTNYLDFATSITSITGDAAAAGSTGIQSLATAAGATGLVAGTDLIKLTTATAVTGTLQTFFNDAITGSSVTGLAANNTGVFVLAYDSTNSQAVLMLASTGANTVLASADVVQLVGTMSMSAADFGNLTNANFAMLA